PSKQTSDEKPAATHAAVSAQATLLPILLTHSPLMQTSDAAQSGVFAQAAWLPGAVRVSMPEAARSSFNLPSFVPSEPGVSELDGVPETHFASSASCRSTKTLFGVTLTGKGGAAGECTKPFMVLKNCSRTNGIAAAGS